MLRVVMQRWHHQLVFPICEPFLTECLSSGITRILVFCPTHRPLWMNMIIDIFM